MKSTVLFLVSLFLLASCEPEEECSIDFETRIDGDTIFFGRWVYQYTISRTTFYFQEPPIVADDTVWMGETRSWMPDGHPVSEIRITPSGVYMVNCRSGNGFACKSQWNVSNKYFNSVLRDSTAINFSIRCDLDDDIVSSDPMISSSGYLWLWFAGVADLMYQWQDPYDQFALVDRYLPNTDTYDFYERVE